ncbi:hypothetical protein KIL84_013587 [Mauremys mutica]|uniref:Uncharacterized protein n=1 Tax=Mauremys mutica TaxID=74926 RepID=A0A9D3WVR4_9SAUR|nr:hypothetical protein KIL84_013587 [Mauremys mutica]
MWKSKDSPTCEFGGDTNHGLSSEHLPSKILLQQDSFDSFHITRSHRVDDKLRLQSLMQLFQLPYRNYDYLQDNCYHWLDILINKCNLQKHIPQLKLFLASFRVKKAVFLIPQII